MNIPTHLSHKPIIGVKDYNDDDAQALSIGLAQWPNDENAISAKVFRYSEDSGRWSRQSEELPLHRVIDLSILIIASFLIDEKQALPLTDLNEIVVDRQQIEKIQQYYHKNRENLDDRVIELGRIVDLYLKRQK